MVRKSNPYCTPTGKNLGKSSFCTEVALKLDLYNSIPNLNLEIESQVNLQPFLFFLSYWAQLAKWLVTVANSVSVYHRVTISFLIQNKTSTNSEHSYKFLHSIKIYLESFCCTYFFAFTSLLTGFGSSSKVPIWAEVFISGYPTRPISLTIWSMYYIYIVLSTI